MACRDFQRGSEAAEEIIRETGNRNVILKKLDLSSFTSVREFAQDIEKTETRVNILINNAGERSLNSHNIW